MSRCRRHAARPTVVLAIIGALAPVSAVPAQTPINRPTTVELHQRAGRISVGAGGDAIPLLETNSFNIRKGARVRVTIADQNPLLFTYSTAVTETDTEQYEIAARVAGTLGEVLAALGAGTAAGPFADDPTAGGGAPARVTVEGLDFDQFREDVDAVARNVDALPDLLPLSMGTDQDIARLKAVVAEWRITARASRIQQGFTQTEEIALKCLRGQPVETSAGQQSCGPPPATQGDASTRVNPTDPGRTQQNTGNKTNVRTDAPPNATRGGRSAVPDAAAPSAPRADGELSIVAAVTLASSLRPKVDALLQVLQDVTKDVATLGTPKVLAERDYSLRRQTITVEMQASKKYDAFLDETAETRRDQLAQTTTVVLEPYSPVRLAFAPAAVLLFIDNPTFTARPDGSTFVIDAADDDVTSYNLAGMLTITPHAWDQPTFGGSFQLGISPTKNRIGFYAGAGISVQDLFSVGGGITWQQVDELTDGLVAGQTISSPADLRTDQRFRRGAYIHITVK